MYSRELALFDFDRTLVSEDSFRLLARLAASGALGQAHLLALSALCKLGLLDNTAYKERVLRRFWAGRAGPERVRLLEVLWARLRKLEHAPVVRLMREHLAQGHDVVVLSASPEFYLRPFVQAWSDRIELYASVYEEPLGLRENVYGSSKAQRAAALIRARRPKRVWVYTDHHADLPLIEMAHEVNLVRPSPRLMRELARRGIAHQVIAV